MYDMPSIQALKNSLPKKVHWKREVNNKINNFWTQKLMEEASSKSSLNSNLTCLKPLPLISQYQESRNWKMFKCMELTPGTEIGNEKSYCKGKNDDWIIYPSNRPTQVQQ